MCGTAEVFSSNRSKSKESLLAIGEYMATQIHHRGPDGHGVVVRQSSNGSNLLLVHSLVVVWIQVYLCKLWLTNNRNQSRLSRLDLQSRGLMSLNMQAKLHFTVIANIRKLP